MSFLSLSLYISACVQLRAPFLAFLFLNSTNMTESAQQNTLPSLAPLPVTFSLFLFLSACPLLHSYDPLTEIVDNQHREYCLRQKR